MLDRIIVDYNGIHDYPPNELTAKIFLFWLISQLTK